MKVDLQLDMTSMYVATGRLFSNFSPLDSLFMEWTKGCPYSILTLNSTRVKTEDKIKLPKGQG